MELSHRYIPARQLPDKAVSLLDTACARVAISQAATPAAVEDARVAIAARTAERDALTADRDLGVAGEARIAEIDADLAAKREALARLEAEWETERNLVEEITRLRQDLGKEAGAGEDARATLAARAASLEERDPRRG